jgi:hypothetical protein
MNKRATIWAIVIISSVIIIPIIWITINNWETVKLTFFTYTFIDLVNVIVTILFGIVVSIYFSLLNNNYLKKTEILFGNMDSLIELFGDIKKSFENDEDSVITLQKQSYYIKIFRDTSKEISNIDQYINLYIKKNTQLQECIKTLEKYTRSMKVIITDKPFQKEYKVLKSDIYLSSERYFTIKACINKIKMLMFS